ncbi:D-glycero-beta-D-manno-heptose 1-phosphate adenylyltransferase [bacterium (candidate division B38) B3_B38]|nr:MAG: D-glycero-beta-D-manno-heptose 1-phosphate adenylyltransferase [bacterium (candidate division B38) B3_B38]
MGTRDKIKGLEELHREVTRLKEEGKVIVLANGCFDLIHVGHIRYLKGAKELGDILIVGVNSDRSVKQIKGKKRPLMSQDERAQIVSAFELVDYVLVFDKPTVEELILTLKPHYHAKGTDYTEESVPEKGVAASCGTLTRVVGGDPKGHSTSLLIRKIIEKYGASH